MAPEQVLAPAREAMSFTNLPTIEFAPPGPNAPETEVLYSYRQRPRELDTWTLLEWLWWCHCEGRFDDARCRVKKYRQQHAVAESHNLCFHEWLLLHKEHRSAELMPAEAPLDPC